MKKPRVALISPQVVCGRNQVRRTQPPLGLGYLAAVMEQEGFEDLLILDAAVEDYQNVIILEDDPNLVKYGMSDGAIIERLREFAPDIVGISCLFSSQAENMFSTANAVKKVFPDVPIVLGGIHSSVRYEEIMRNYPAIDFILAGEGDYTFKDLAEKLFNREDYTRVLGLIWRDGRTLKINPKPSFIDPIDKLLFPAWHLMNMEKYFEIAMPHNPFVKSGRVGCIITSRGCPQRCYFCSSSDFFGHRFRPMSASRVIEMVQYLVDRFDIKELQILDDTFTIDYKRVIEICEGIKQFNLRITLPNGVRADLPRDHEHRLEMFHALREAGCEQIGIAAEHGDQDFLNNVINKNSDLNDVVVTCDLAHKAGLLVHCNFMVGFPFETVEQRQHTASFARNLQADSFSVSLATPLPGTKMWDIVEKNGLFINSFSANRILYGQVSIRPNNISVKELQKFVKDLNKELNTIGMEQNPVSKEKYKLFKGKTASGDRKYQYSDTDM